MSEMDLSRGYPEERLHQNFMALAAEGEIKRIMYVAATINVASLADGAGATSQVTLNGVALGDIVLGVSAGVDLQDMTVTAYVQAANTIEIRVQNESGGVIDLASTTFRVLVADVT